MGNIWYQYLPQYLQKYFELTISFCAFFTVVELAGFCHALPLPLHNCNSCLRLPNLCPME
jgi:hypothetical protein